MREILRLVKVFHKADALVINLLRIAVVKDPEVIMTFGLYDYLN